jgi:3-oxoacyl-[acyl-carrier-protein] synthase-3
MLNEELAAAAAVDALSRRGADIRDVGMLAAGTTQPDLPVPGFASMVHGRLGGGPKEILSAGGVCCSGVAALRCAEDAVRLGRHRMAVAIGSELASRSLRAGRLGPALAGDRRAAFNAEFLRWMLSDGAGAAIVEPLPRPEGLSLRIDWSTLESHADRFPACMFAGVVDSDAVVAGATWQDQPTAAVADGAGMLNLRQDVSMLDAVVALGVQRYVTLVRDGLIEPDGIDHLLCHYSSEHFRAPIVELMSEAGLMIPEERWFTNLHSKGNTGAASIYIMLEEALDSGLFDEGDRILLMVPESGRFSVAFLQLTCVGPGHDDAPSTVPAVAPATAPAGGAPGAAAAARGDRGAPTEWLLEELTLVWAEFEQRLARVPIVRRIESGTATLADYRDLLRNLRQQVMEGARWITRAASSLTVEHTDLRARFIHHAAEEQRDFRMLERDFVACGGQLARIRAADKNVGSEALSAFMFQRAGRTDPLDLLGAMYIIEGLGANKAGHWMTCLRDHLDLDDDQVSFLRHHSGADEEHTAEMFEILRSDLVTWDLAPEIVRTARVVARLYALQLEELDHG